MILVALTITALHGMSAAIPGADRYGPFWALIAAIWCGARADESSGVRFATMVGLGAGFFAVGPIAETAFFCVLASTFAATFRLALGKTREAPIIIAFVTVILVFLAQFAWQSFVRSLNVSAWSVGECLLRSASTLLAAPIVIRILDRTRLASRI